MESSRAARTALSALPPAIAAVGAVYVASAEGRAYSALELWYALLCPLPLYLASRAWRLPWWLQAGAASLPLSVLLVAAVHADPAGAARASRLAGGVLLLLGAIAWARTARRRIAVAIAAGAVGLLPFLLYLPSWVGQGDSNALFLSLLSSYTQFAGLEVAALALGGALFVIGRGAAAGAGAAIALLTGTGLLLAGTRYGLALGIAVAVALLLAGLRLAVAERSPGPLLRPVVAVVAALALTALLRSPLVFPGAVVGMDDLAPATGRSNAEFSLQTRLDFWRAALEIGAQHPVAGVGLLQFDDYAGCYPLVYRSWQPHNEWLYAWATGGAIMLAPMLLLVVALAVLVLRSLRPLPTAAALRRDPARWGGLLGISAGVAHLVPEFDLWFPAILTVYALAASVAAAPLVPRSSARPALRTAAAALVAIAVVGGAIALLVDPTVGTHPWLPQGKYPTSCPTG